MPGSDTKQQGGDQRDIAAEVLRHARTALAAFEDRLSASAGRTADRVDRLRSELKEAAQRAPSDDAPLLRDARTALAADRDACAQAETIHRAVATDLFADLDALVKILP